MPKLRPASRRKQLILRYSALSLLVVAGATAAAVLLLRQPQEKYSPGGPIEGVTSDLQRDLPAGRPAVSFVDQTSQAGIDFRHFAGARSSQLPEDMGSGAAWGDYDNDGYFDLYICDIAAPLTASPEERAASPGGNRLYHNNRDGTFTDVTSRAGVGFKGLSMGAAWADYDNDGWLDLAVTAYGEVIVYRNRGDGTFEDVSARAGFAGFEGFWSGASWADYDNDGNADLYICGYIQYESRPEYSGKTSKQYAQVIPFTLNPSSYKPERNLLFHNNGDGTFSEVAAEAGVGNPAGRSLSAAWADYDLDGLPDLYVANDVSDNALFRNRGDGTFEDVSHPAWAADYRGAMGLAVADWDNDGDSDIFVTHWIAQENGFYWNLVRSASPSETGPRLKFTDIADMLGLGQISLNDIGWGTSFLDYDNDGRLDLFVVNGSTFQREEDPSLLVAMRNRLFWQKSPEDGFFDVSTVSGEALSEERVSRGAAFADYDNDGDIDIFIVNHQAAPTLLRNENDTENHWLKVRVTCVQSNRSCLGARVEIQTPLGKQRRELGAQSSYLSQNALEAHFGLGSAASVKQVRVVFPSGVVRTLENVPSNQIVAVKE